MDVQLPSSTILIYKYCISIKSSLPLVLQKAASSLVACRCINLIQKNKTISPHDKYFKIDAAISIYNLTKCFWLKAERNSKMSKLTQDIV
jgi:hypothetical protein